jgi:hypothetical protein
MQYPQWVLPAVHDGATEVVATGSAGQQFAKGDSREHNTFFNAVLHLDNGL